MTANLSDYTIRDSFTAIDGIAVYWIEPTRVTGPSRSSGLPTTICAEQVCIDPTDGETWAWGRLYRKDGTLANRAVKVSL